MSDNIDYVAEATTLGWVPQDKWSGDPEKWVDAETYVKKGEKLVPMLIRDKRELAAKTRKQQEEIDQLKSDGVRFREMMEKQVAREKEELEQQINELKAAKSQAVTDGEGDKVVKIDETLEALKEEKKKLETPPPKKDEPKVHPDFPAWHAENSWYGSDPQLTKAADGVAIVVSAANPGLTGKALYDEISKEMAKLAIFKAKFPDKEDKTINRVEDTSDTGPGEGSTRNNRAKGYDSLPPEAKQECVRYIQNGWISKTKYKTEKEQREAYAKIYFENESKGR